MGILGLLPFVQKACRPTNINEFSGCTVAIDGHCWLHRAIYGCADQLINGQATVQYVTFCVRYLNMLKSHKITPIVVFDGNSLPSKRDVRLSRQKRKRDMRSQGESLEKDGNLKEARQCYVQSLDITSDMVADVITACRENGVDYLVAPFEADAQLTYLLNKGIVHLVVTEDSDLIPFGCKRIMFKLDLTGNGTLYERRLLYKCLSPRAELLLSPSKRNDDMLFTRFRYACIMSGCDYHPGGLPGVGLLKATKAMLSCSNLLSIDKMLNRLPTYLHNLHLTITTEYKQKFIRANQTFLHQIVFDPLTRKLLPLTPLPDELRMSDLTYAGHGILTDWDALHMALGNIKIHYPSSQNNDSSQSSQNDSRVPNASSVTPISSPETPRKSGIWCSTYRLPSPLKSPTRPPPVTRRHTTSGEIVIVDMTMDSPGQKSTILPPDSPLDEVKTPSAPKTSLSELKNSPVRNVESAKRKLFVEPGDGENDEIPQPKTPKRSFSYSAPQEKKFSRGIGLSRTIAREVSAKSQLKMANGVVRSSYFSATAESAVGKNVQQQAGISQDGTFRATINMGDNDDVLIMQSSSSSRPSPIPRSSLPHSTPPSRPVQLAGPSFRLDFSHLAYRPAK